MSIPFIIHRTLQEMTIPFTISLAVTDRAAGAPLLTQAAEQVSTALARINRLYSPFRETSLVRRFQAGDQGYCSPSRNFKKFMRPLWPRPIIPKGISIPSLTAPLIPPAT